MQALLPAALLALTLILPAAGAHAGAARAKRVIHVVIWDERQEAQKEAYSNYLGNAIADYLRQGGTKGPAAADEMDVQSVALSEPEHGLPASTLDKYDVLVWWGHQRHGDVPDALAKDIVERVRAGKLVLIALHSAHWSKPFIAAMEARTLQDAERSLTATERKTVRIVVLPADRRLVSKTDRPTPYMDRKRSPAGEDTLNVKLPGCAFTDVRADGSTSHMKLLVSSLPLAAGIPKTWDVPHTEIYDGPFQVPHPDVTLFEETWDGGQSFPSGCLWSLGKGFVYYFRPGHETFPIYKQAEPLRVVENAIRYLGPRVHK